MKEFLIWYYSLSMEGTFILTYSVVFAVGVIAGLVLAYIERKIGK